MKKFVKLAYRDKFVGYQIKSNRKRNFFKVKIMLDQRILIYSCNSDSLVIWGCIDINIAYFASYLYLF